MDSATVGEQSIDNNSIGSLQVFADQEMTPSTQPYSPSVSSFSVILETILLEVFGNDDNQVCDDNDTLDRQRRR